MLNTRLAIAVAASLWLILSPVAHSAESTEQEKKLLSVNGVTLSQDLFAAYVRANRQRFGAKANDQQTQRTILNELVNLVLLSQAAEQEKLQETPEVIAFLQVNDLQILAQAMVESIVTTSPVTDEEVQQLYNQKYVENTLQEYLLSHIQTDSEESAQEVIQALNEGQAFDQLAKEKSNDLSAKNGGDLGWLGASQLPLNFKQQVTGMKAGDFSEKPLQSPTGWHVLLLREVRDQAVPSLEQETKNLRGELQKQRVTEKINALRKEAKIESINASPEQ